MKTFPCNEIAPQCGIEGVDHEEISQFRALIKASDFDAAFSLAKNSVLDAHTSTEMLEWLGTFELLSGDFESSEKTLIQAQSQAGSTVSLLIKLALVYMEMGDYSKMMELFETAIQVDPNNPAIYYHRGEIYSLSNDLESAISEFSRAIELDPGFVPAYVHQARAYLAKDMISTAKSVLESALQHLQDNSEILHVLGECYALEGDIDRSIAIFDRVICLSPNSPQYLLSKSIVISKGDHGKISQEFEKQLLDIVEKFPRFDAARLQLAGYYADINNFDAAFEQYNIVTAHARTYQEIWVICTVRSLCKAQAYVIGKYPELSSEVQRILGSL